MGLEQRIIQKKINNNEMITQCCITGLFKGVNNDWIGFRLKEPYNNISHGYCLEQFQNIMYEIKSLKNKINKL